MTQAPVEVCSHLGKEARQMWDRGFILCGAFLQEVSKLYAGTIDCVIR